MRREEKRRANKIKERKIKRRQKILLSNF